MKIVLKTKTISVVQYGKRVWRFLVSYLAKGMYMSIRACYLPICRSRGSIYIAATIENACLMNCTSHCFHVLTQNDPRSLFQISFKTIKDKNLLMVAVSTMEYLEIFTHPQQEK